MSQTEAAALLLDSALATTELPPPPEPKRKDKKHRPHPRKGALTRRGPPRPYRRLAEDTLKARVQKLTTRMERAKTQHESARGLLMKYVHEQTYRLRDALVAQDRPAEEADALHPLPELRPVDSAIPEPPPAVNQ